MNTTLPIQHDSYPFISKEKFAGKLNGKVVIVTGTSGGIGAAIAKSFGNAGAKVACVARSEDKLKAVVAEINSKGPGKAIAVVGDVGKKGAPQEILSKVEAELGPIDILVNNAGIARIGALEDEPEDLDVWWRVYEINVRAPVSMVRAVLPSMIKRKSGHVITVSSSVATLALPAMTAYASSKAATSKFHQSLASELEGTGVTSFAVHPGIVATNLGQSPDGLNKASAEHPATKSFIAGLDPNQDGQTPELAADLIVALATEDRFKKLSGKHLNVEQDLESVITEFEKEGGGRIEKEQLYRVNIGAL